MPLNDAKVRAAKPKEKTYRLTDGGGMYLEVTPQGGRYWRLKYRVAGKEKRLALGVYPEVSLLEARAKRDAARLQLAAGVDPSGARQDAKRATAQAAANSFEVIAREWLSLKTDADGNAAVWTESHLVKVTRTLEQLIFPTLGHRPVDAIKASEILELLRAIEGRGTVDRAKRVRQVCGEVFRYAIVTERADSNPAAELARALKPRKQEHYAALSADQLPAFLHALKTAPRIAQVTRLGLRLLALTFVRPGELQAAQWDEFDLDGALWTIPSHRMKRRREHVVPLSEPALAALRELHTLTGYGPLLFPSRSNARRPMSANTLRLALHRMGFEVTAHGFRSTASTILNETGFRPDVIEAQLAHADRNKIRAAYNRALYMPERRELMRHWGEYLTALEAGGKVIPFNQRKGAAT